MILNFIQYTVHWQQLAPMDRSVSGTKMPVQNSSRQKRWNNRLRNVVSMLMDKSLHTQLAMIGQKVMNITMQPKKHTFTCVHVLTNLSHGHRTRFLHKISVHTFHYLE